ncbi:MAG: NAD(P)-dependent oxidoreductase [Gemmatimonadetes bacterium]|nr:NAD(P)-dependent oxidoreductase [Gemmatimonadota bacterium]
MRIAFLGTGHMGLPMARNLAAAGHEVTAWNRSREKAEPLAEHGVRIADTPAEAAQEAEVAITMLAEDHAVEEVVFGDEGFYEALPQDAVHVSCSTIGVEFSRTLADAHDLQRQGYVAAPVFGRPEAADARKLKVVAAGAADVVERVRPLFDAIGERTFLVGDDPSLANVVKLCGNFLIASMIETLGESFALARKSGVPEDVFLEILNGTFFSSPIFAGYAKAIAEKRFQPAGFKLRLGLKDVRLALAAADRAEVPMPAASLLHDRFLTGVATGRGDHDWSGIAGLVAEAAGLD